MIKSTVIKLFISTLVATTPVLTTAYTSTGIYYADSQTVVDASGEEWGYDTELEDNTPVIITFDSQNTDSRYDDVITIGNNNALSKTQDINEATRFISNEVARYVKATHEKRCKGYHPMNLNPNKDRRKYSADVKRMVYLRNNGRCAICGKRVDLNKCNLDHRIPISKGGIDAVENLDCVHVKCNYIKADLMPDELEKGIKDIFLYQMEKNRGHKLRCRIAKAVLRKIC